ncbi:13289_t:CDS:2 [Dentiscutata erythropus]|uniref:13289_t:CDS:1 n=1 Tax=Dentiscutata erythropus TaxID=1348616 RepID=A0A9N8Z1K0_9GLOM|nr:13289_t:CDS:2 [Dentiscutata erythropus]
MFICSVCNEIFGRLTCLINHKKIHKNYYQVEDSSDDCTDENTEIHSSDESDESEVVMFNNQAIVDNEHNPLVDISNPTLEEYSSTFDETNLMSEESSSTSEEISSTSEEISSTSEESNSPFEESSSTFNEFNSTLDLIADERSLFSGYSEEKLYQVFSTPIVQIKGQVYSFEYQPIISAVKEILQNQEIATNCVFDYEEIYSSIEAIYSEFYNCNWWDRAQQCIPSENKVLPIILYSDATMLDRLEKISCHPVFISLGNIPTRFRNKPEAKALVGIIPTLQGTKEERQTPQFRQLIQTTFHKCMNDKLNTINLPSNRKIIRTESQMKQVIAMGQGKDYSIHEETNSFWNHLDFLKSYGGAALVNKMDLRFGLIPRYPGLKIFNVGLADLALFTASEYKHMMKVMPFILEGLFEDKKKK